MCILTQLILIKIVNVFFFSEDSAVNFLVLYTSFCASEGCRKILEMEFLVQMEYEFY